MVLLAATPMADRAADATPNSTRPLRPEVSAAASDNAWTPVIVTLREPAAIHAPGRLDRGALKQQIAGTQSGVLAQLNSADFQLSYRYEGISAVAGSVSPGGLKKLANNSDVVDITLDGIGQAADAESLPLIHADAAQTLGYTGAGITAAVIDSGADLPHPDLSDDIVVQECFQLGGGCPVTGTSRASGPGAAQDDLGHGTNVTGIITSKGTVAPIGVAPNVKIAAYKALNSSDFGFFSDWTAALSDIIANHPEVKLINMSLQSLDNLTGACDNYQPATTAAINTLRAAGTLTFVAAGNHAQKQAATYPSCISSAVSVGAVWDANVGSQNFSVCGDPVTSADRVTCFSNSDSSTLDLLGPGAYITSTGLGGGLSTYAGTSQATPHAVGVAALLEEAQPSLTADQVEFRLKTTGQPVTDPANGRITPRLDALNALNPVDTDGDGMPNAYESWHGCLNAAANDAAGDPDGDGISTSAEFSAQLNPCSPDTDGDGCPEGREMGVSHITGGQRDPRNPWDFFDVPAPALLPPNTTGTRNHAIGIQDVIAVLAYIGANIASPNTPNANGATYGSDLNGNGLRDGTEYDRAAGATIWAPNPPNGAINISDALLSLNAVGDNCN